MSESEKKLSNKELKELKKKEKAARRAAQKTAEGKDPTPQQPQQKLGGSNSVSPGSVAGQLQQQAKKKGNNANAPTTTQIKKSINRAVDVNDSKVPLLFSHLTTREQRSQQLPLSVLQMIHPLILELSGKFANYEIVGSISRCRALLETFKTVIKDYRTPENMTLSRSLTSYLSYQIDYLKNARPLSITMGNAIRWLKQEISLISIDVSEDESKNLITSKIDKYISEKIEYTDKMIIKFASPHITDNSTILTFGHSNVLEELFLHCYNVENKKNITIIIIDSRPLFEGKKLLKNLVDQGFRNCKYYLINSLSNVLQQMTIDYVFLGAHAMLSNGRLYSRVGTAVISMMCHKQNIPILVCCELIKFTERIQLDSVTQNELGDYHILMDLDVDPPKKKNFALENFIKAKHLAAKEAATSSKGKKNNSNNNNKEDASLWLLLTPDGESPLKNSVDQIENLKVLNIMYDLTPSNYINKIITELGALPPSSVPVILREYKSG